MPLAESQFIGDDDRRPRKRRQVEMPSVADGFTARDTTKTVIPRFTPKPPPQPSTSHPKTPLKQVLPPSFSLPSPISTKLLHPPPPPPKQNKTQSSEQDKDLKTISTTSIGLLNSLSSSNGGEDLAAFLLPHRDQSGGSVTVTATSRGIELSPEKRGKGHNPKFIRGGLAARASAVYNRAHTSLVLWQKETERRARSVPDLTATIVRVLHLPRPPPNSTKLSPVIALCRIHHQNDSYAYPPNQLYRVIFSFPQLSLDRFKEGLTVRIFHPWHELSSPAVINNPDSSSSTSLLQSRCPPPASLPLLLSLPPTPDLPINTTTTLLCSRFIF